MARASPGGDALSFISCEKVMSLHTPDDEIFLQSYIPRTELQTLIESAKNSAYYSSLIKKLAFRIRHMSVPENNPEATIRLHYYNNNIHIGVTAFNHGEAIAFYQVGCEPIKAGRFDISELTQNMRMNPFWEDTTLAEIIIQERWSTPSNIPADSEVVDEEDDGAELTDEDINRICYEIRHGKGY